MNTSHRTTPFFLFPLLLVVLLLVVQCVSGSIPNPVSQHRCMFDEMMMKHGPTATAVVREVPRRGEGATQTYTVAKEDDNNDDSSEWAPIRIKVSAKDLYKPDRYCSAERETRVNHDGHSWTCRHYDVLTDDKKEILLKQILPAAIKLHSDRLSVRPVMGSIIIPQTNIGMCRNFSIPRKHHTEGVSDADMVLYVSAFPYDDSNAWASVCVKLEDKRTVAAAINFSPHNIVGESHTVRAAAHEMGHALGFHHYHFKALKMITGVPNVRGKEKVWVISSPKVKEMARKYYNCPDIEGVELEDEGVSAGSAGSHWEKRNMKDEIMSTDMGIGYYSALTLATFEAMRVYKVNYSMAEPLRWGNNSGCSLLKDRCMTDGETNYTDMFCKQPLTEAKLLCTHDRLSLGYCNLGRHKGDPPPQYQYFSDSKLVGGEPFMDYCPIVVKRKSTGCTNGYNPALRGSFIGPNSRCVKGQNIFLNNQPIGDLCVNTQCDDGTLKVQFKDDDKWYECTEGQIRGVPGDQWSGSIVCPKYTDVCYDLPDINSYKIPVVEGPQSKENQEPDKGNGTNDMIGSINSSESLDDREGNAEALPQQNVKVDTVKGTTPTENAGGEKDNTEELSQQKVNMNPMGRDISFGRNVVGGFNSFAFLAVFTSVVVAVTALIL